MSESNKVCSYCGEYHPQYGDICPVYEEHKDADAQDAKEANEESEKKT